MNPLEMKLSLAYNDLFKGKGKPHMVTIMVGQAIYDHFLSTVEDKETKATRAPSARMVLDPHLGSEEFKIL